MFIEFMPKRINKIFDDVMKEVSKPGNMFSEYVNRILIIIEFEVQYTSLEIMKKLSLNSKETFQKKI